MASSSLSQAFLQSLAASLSVLLTLVYGYLAAVAKLVHSGSERDISRLCVKVFLPALLFTSVGSELSAGKILDYWPIVVWCLVYTAAGAFLGYLGHRCLGLPRWSMVACTFNNTTSLPLLLLKSLSGYGLLDPLKWGSGDTLQAMMSRAESYVLVNAMISNVITFAVGPRMLRGSSDAASEDQHDDLDDAMSPEEEESQPLLVTQRVQKRIKVHWQATRDTAGSIKIYLQQLLPSYVKNFFAALFQLMSGPLLGALLAIFVGVIPGLHDAFFSDGGVFTSWLTRSIRNVSDLFTSLQMFIVGSKLTKPSSAIGWRTIVYIFLVRFIIPSAAIPLVLLARPILRPDPMFWFILAISPIGPPEFILASLAEIARVDQKPIARLLAISYGITPIICVPIALTLHAIGNS